MKKTDRRIKATVWVAIALLGTWAIYLAASGLHKQAVSVTQTQHSENSSPSGTTSVPLPPGLPSRPFEEQASLVASLKTDGDVRDYIKTHQADVDRSAALAAATRMLKAWETVGVPQRIVSEDIADTKMPTWYRDFLLGFVTLGPGARMLEDAGQREIKELAGSLVSDLHQPIALRKRALFALSQIDPARASALAKQLTADQNDEMAEAATLALKAMQGPQTPPPLRQPQRNGR